MSLYLNPLLDNKHRRSCLASGRSASGRGPATQGRFPRSPMLPFDTLEGAWWLSWRIPEIHREIPMDQGPDQSLPPQCLFNSSSGFSAFLSNCQALVVYLRPRRRCHCRCRWTELGAFDLALKPQLELRSYELSYRAKPQQTPPGSGHLTFVLVPQPTFF